MVSRVLGAIVCCSLLVAACGGAIVEETTTTTTTMPSTTTVAPVTTVAETTTTQPERLSAQEVFRLVSPALGFIENSIGSGSGVVYREGLLLTNFHVVWPDTTVRVTFPDGSELRNAPVLASDMLADLAVVDISGFDSAPAPVATGSAEDFAIGSELFLIGYPGETDEFPDATITGGILSRIRQARAFGLTYLQTDAVIAGGQSGGALVSDSGVVVGISGFGIEGFALATSMPDVEDLVDRMLDGEDTDGLDRDDLAAGDPGEDFEVTLDNFLHDIVFLIDEPVGTRLTIEGDSEADIVLALVAADGFIEVFADEGETGIETVEFRTSLDGPHFLAVNAFAFSPVTARITSNVPIHRIDDPDDGATLTIGDRRIGAFDGPGDNDYFVVDLEEGATVEILVESLLAIPGVIIDQADNEGEPLGIAEDGSGGGLFGTDQLLTFTAPATGTYLVGVGDVAGLGPAGYVLTVTALP